MSVEGPLGAYVNPGGHVHEMLTVSQTRGLRLIGRPTVENSWFDGCVQQWQCDNYNLKLHRRCNNLSHVNSSGYVGYVTIFS